MIVDGIILALIIAYLRGGSFKGFEKVELRGGKVIVVLFGIQLLLLILSYKIEVLALTAPYWVNLFSLGFIYLAWLNRKVPGFNLILIGISLNFLVMVTNGGRMPVSVEAAGLVTPDLIPLLYKEGYKHFAMTDKTWLWFLGDIIPLMPPYPNNKVISAGDVLLNVGGFIFVWKSMFLIRRKKVEGFGGETI